VQGFPWAVPEYNGETASVYWPSQKVRSPNSRKSQYQTGLDTPVGALEAAQEAAPLIDAVAAEEMSELGTSFLE
jgi:hypothetical protein